MKNTGERFGRHLRETLSAFFRYTRRDQRGLILLGIVAGGALLFPLQRNPEISAAIADKADSLIASRNGLSPEENRFFRSGDSLPARDSLFRFDPNRASAENFVRLGFSEKQAAAILRYRAAGAVFRKPEDFGRCHVVSDRMYARLAPYIDLPRNPAADRKSKETVGLKPVKTELNRADSAALRAVRGIGEVLCRRILDYRKRLGGFVRKSQLLEIRGITEANFPGIAEQIYVDSAVIQKIDINFAPANTLSRHPYFTASMVKRIEDGRKTKGGWNTLKEMTDEDILLPDEAERVSPYAAFGRLR